MENTTPKTPEKIEPKFTLEEARDITRRYEELTRKSEMAKKIYEKAQEIIALHEQQTTAAVPVQEENGYEQYKKDLAEKTPDFASAFSPENLQKMQAASEASVETTPVPAVDAVNKISPVEENGYDAYKNDQQKLADSFGDIANAFSPDNLKKMYPDQATTEPSTENTSSGEDVKKLSILEKLWTEPLPGTTPRPPLEPIYETSPADTNGSEAIMAPVVTAEASADTEPGSEPQEPTVTTENPALVEGAPEPLITSLDEPAPAADTNPESTPQGNQELSEQVKNLSEQVEKLTARLDEKVEQELVIQTPEQQAVSKKAIWNWTEMLQKPERASYEAVRDILLNIVKLAGGITGTIIKWAAISAEYARQKVTGNVTNGGIMAMLKSKFAKPEKTPVKAVEKPVVSPEVKKPEKTPEEILAEKKKAFLEKNYSGKDSADRLYHWKSIQKVPLEKFFNPEKYTWEGIVKKNEKTGMMETVTKQVGQVTLANYRPENKKMYDLLSKAYEKVGYNEFKGTTVEEFLDYALTKNLIETSA